MIMVLNKFNGAEQESHLNPSLDIVLRLLGREGRGVYTDYAQEFEKGDVTPQQEKEMEVKRR